MAESIQVDNLIFFKKNNRLAYLWVCWVSVVMWVFSTCGEQGLSSWGAWTFHWGGFCCCRTRAQELWQTDFLAPWHLGPYFPDRGLSKCPLRWQADSFPLDRGEDPITVSCIITTRAYLPLAFCPQEELNFGGAPKITADGDCSHEIKRRLLLGRKLRPT